MEHAEHSNSNAPMEYRSEIGRLNILGFWIFLERRLFILYVICDLCLFFITEQREAYCRQNCSTRSSFDHDVPAVNEQFHMRHCSA
jgi:hypothetical protein